jgi:hypothetical protein
MIPALWTNIDMASRGGRATPDGLAVNTRQTVSTPGKSLHIPGVVGEARTHLGVQDSQIAPPTTPAALGGLHGEWETERLSARGDHDA